MSAVGQRWDDENDPPGRVDPGIILIAVSVVLALLVVLMYLSAR